MKDRVEVCCPCCGNKMVVDPASGEVLSEQRPKKPAKSFDEALGQVRAGSKKREDAFSKAFDRTRHLDELLEKKFEEARKKTKDDKSRPPSPLDLD